MELGYDENERSGGIGKLTVLFERLHTQDLVIIQKDNSQQEGS